MTIKILPTATCLNSDCKTEFRYYGTIKPKLCPRCQNLKDFEKKREDSKLRIENNKKLLAQSTFGSKNKTSGFKTGKYTIKERKGLKRLKTSRQKAMDLADMWFSRFIRIKYHFQILTDGTVLNKCIISGAIKKAISMDNGHCFSRSFKATRFEEDNCRPQNRSSNRFSGEADHYKFIDNLKSQIGEERFNRIDELRKQEGEDSKQFYLEQAEKYRKLTNELLTVIEAKKWW